VVRVWPKEVPVTVIEGNYYHLDGVDGHVHQPLQPLLRSGLGMARLFVLKGSQVGHQQAQAHTVCAVHVGALETVQRRDTPALSR
jgi:hypothetical protein